MKAKVYNIKSKKRMVSLQEYTELLDTAEILIGQLRPIRKDQAALDTAMDLIKELRFCGLLNNKAREQTVVSLEKLLDDMYEEVNGEDSGQEKAIPGDDESR